MRILIATGLYPPEIGGPATYAKLFEERLPRYGIEVSVLPFRDVRHLPPIIRHIVYGWKIARLARHADCILVQDTVSTGFPAAVAALFIRKPLVLRVPGDYAWEQGVQRFGVKESLDDFQKRRYGLAVSILRLIQRFVVGRAKRVIAPSQYLARIVAEWSSRQKKVDIIYNGIELSSDQKQTHRKSNLIVSSGRLVSWKGFKELIDVVSSHKEWTLDIIGDGPQHLELKDRIWEMGGEKHVTLRGSMPHAEVLRAFADAAVFVLNSQYEGLSHTLIEAFATGTPVIATRAGGNPEVVQEGMNGILVDVGDAAALEKAIARLLSDETLRENMGRAARARAKEFSIDKTIEATASLLKSCVS